MCTCPNRWISGRCATLSRRSVSTTLASSAGLTSSSSSPTPRSGPCAWRTAPPSPCGSANSTTWSILTRARRPRAARRTCTSARPSNWTSSTSRTAASARARAPARRKAGSSASRPSTTMRCSTPAFTPKTRRTCCRRCTRPWGRSRKSTPNSRRRTSSSSSGSASAALEAAPPPQSSKRPGGFFLSPLGGSGNGLALRLGQHTRCCEHWPVRTMKSTQKADLLSLCVLW
mmetsp:Transcript_20010/g.45325  ORF Transcript_20010/g.45325 Transcript_20010/m.45325 type:complete len:230 (+) Transcript_20010:1766-2455(+)